MVSRELGIKHMYDLFLEVKRLRTVATRLNAAGYRTRNGSGFSNTTVRRLLQDPTAKGIRRSNYTESRGNGKAWDLKSPDEWIITPVEAIVEDRYGMLATRFSRIGETAGNPPSEPSTSSPDWSSASAVAR